MNVQVFSYILLSFILISTFIAIFFFTFVVKVESDIIKEQVKDIVNDMLSLTKVGLTDSERIYIGNQIVKNMQTPDMRDIDQKVKMSNRELLKVSAQFFGIILVIGTILLLACKYFGNISFRKTVIYTIVMLVLVAITEVFFVSFIVKNYKLIDKNFIYYSILQSLKDLSR